MITFDADFRPSSTSTQIITMHFRNRAIDTYSPTFSATPAMSQSQILLALGATLIPSLLNNNSMANQTDTLQNFNNDFIEQNKQPTTDSENNATAVETALRTGGDFVGRYINRATENLLRRIPFIDVVSVRTNFISNLAIDQLSNPADPTLTTPANTDSSNFNILNYLAGSSVNAGSYLTPEFFLQGSIGVERESNTQHYMQDNSERLVPTIGLNMQFTTPAFTVEWGINPNLANLNAFLKPNVSLTLSKTFTFKDWNDLRQQLSGQSSE
jgi:hypothetical protein